MGAAALIEANQDALLFAGLAGVVFLALKTLEVLAALAVPALVLLAGLVGLGVSTQLSGQYPNLGSPTEVFLDLSGLTILGVGGTAVYIRVLNAAQKAVASAKSKLAELQLGARNPFRKAD